jgi:hypothetical protein
MHGEPFRAGAEVFRGSERVRQDEHAPLRPPQRHLFPGAPRPDWNELKRADAGPRHHVVGNAEPRSERRAIAIVPIEQLEDACRSSGCADALVEPVPVECVDQPDAAVRNERVRAALHELVGDPAESVAELVAIADSHPGESTGTA